MADRRPGEVRSRAGHGGWREVGWGWRGKYRRGGQGCGAGEVPDNSTMRLQGLTGVAEKGRRVERREEGRRRGEEGDGVEGRDVARGLDTCQGPDPGRGRRATSARAGLVVGDLLSTRSPRALLPPRAPVDRGGRRLQTWRSVEEPGVLGGEVGPREVGDDVVRVRHYS